jgi:hypothetical protein
MRIDYTYSLEVWLQTISLTEWFGKVLRAMKADLSPEAVVAEQREIVTLIDNMQDVAAEINAIADAAEGISAGGVDEEVQVLIDQMVAEHREQTQSPDDELAERRRRRDDARQAAQQHATEVKGLAAGE